MNVAGQLSDASDVKNVLDFMLCLLLDGHLSDADVNLRTKTSVESDKEDAGYTKIVVHDRLNRSGLYS